MTITTLRPDSRTVVGAYTAVGGASDACVSDNSDATYVVGAAKNAYIGFGYNSLTLTATQRVRSVNIRARCASASSGHLFTNTVFRINNNAGVGYQVGQLLVKRADTNPVTFTGPLAYLGPGGAQWNQSLIDNIGTYQQCYLADDYTANFQRTHELYLDVDVNEQPIVSGAPTVTNFVNNSTPTVAWNYFDADNDPQGAWRVKIFDQATYTTGNFSPDTSTPIVDSLSAPGNDSQWTSNKALINGVTYKAYVAAAHVWPIIWKGSARQTALNAHYWWSEWVASAPFTVTFTTPPYTPTILSAGIIADGNAYRASLIVDAPVNMLTYDNSSFEGGIGQWVADSNMSAPTSVATDHLDGSHCAQFSSTAGGTMVARCELDLIGEPTVDVGKTITVIGSFKTAVSARSCSMGIRWLNAAGGTISDVFGSTVTDATGGVGLNWTQAFVTATVPAGATNAKPLARVASTGGAAEVHRLDNVSVHAGTSTTWTPGGYQNGAGDLLIERGDRCDDARGPAENLAHPVVATCGTTIRGVGQGFRWDFTDRLDFMWLDKVIPEAGNTPAGMLRWSPTVATTTQPLWFGWWPYFPAKDYAFPVVPGQAHVFSVWAWCDSGTFVITPWIDWCADDESFVSSSAHGANVTLTTTPQKITISAVAPSSGVSMARGNITNANSDNTKHVFFTRAGWGLGSVPVDGKAPMGGPITWTPIRFPIDEFGSFPVGADSGQRRVYSDFEIPTGRPALYRASITLDTNISGLDVLVGSAYSTQAVVYGVPPTQTLLRSITDPALQVAVNRRKAVIGNLTDDAQIFHPLGADGAPVRVRDWVGGEDGQLIVITSTEAQYARLRALIACGDVMQIQWAQGGRTYCLITDRQLAETVTTDVDWCDADGTQGWLRYDAWTLTYIETQAP